MQHAPLLARTPHRPDAGQPLIGPLRLARARVHEAHGPARHMVALLLARAMTGPVFWIAPGWEGARLYAPGMANLGVDPGRLTFVTAGHAIDILWTLEESLRAGAVPLVVGELPGPPGLTALRRMQLAAEAGAQRGAAPIGLVLTPQGGTTGAESRWHMAPDHAPDRTAWTLARERARSDPPASWIVTPGVDGFALAPAEAQAAPAGR
jgi:protein ImuA